MMQTKKEIRADLERKVRIQDKLTRGRYNLLVSCKLFKSNRSKNWRKYMAARLGTGLLLILLFSFATWAQKEEEDVQKKRTQQKVALVAQILPNLSLLKL